MSRFTQLAVQTATEADRHAAEQKRIAAEHKARAVRAIATQHMTETFGAPDECRQNANNDRDVIYFRYEDIWLECRVATWNHDIQTMGSCSVGLTEPCPNHEGGWHSFDLSITGGDHDTYRGGSAINSMETLGRVLQRIAANRNFRGRCTKCRSITGREPLYTVDLED